MKPKPNYYAIIPATVRYDETLAPNAKLLYGEITALANSTGTCTASNRYFAKLYGVALGTASAWVNALLAKGYIDVDLSVNGTGPREIRIPLRDFAYTPTEKADGAPNEKAEHNNTRINNNNPTLTSDLEAAVTKSYRLYLRYFIFDTDYDDDNERAYAEAMKRYRLTPKRRAALERRFTDAKPKMVYAAIVGFGRDDFYSGKKTEWKADLADYICRSYENIEKGARLYEEQQKNSAGDPR